MMTIKICEDGAVGLFMPDGKELPCVQSYQIEELNNDNLYGASKHLSVTVTLIVKNELFKHGKEDKAEIE